MTALALAGLVAAAAGRAAPPAADAPAAPAAAQQARFDVLEYRVLGNTVLPVADVERAVYPLLGPDHTMADVEAARLALERLYHDRGYNTVFVDIPEQTVDEGVVRVRVVEGRLRQVKVTGARYFSNGQIRALLPEARPGAVPNLPKLQQQITALNTQTRDRAVVPVLKAGPVPGTVDLNLAVTDHLPFHGSLELNNQQSVDTDPLRLFATLGYDNLFGRLDSASVQYQTSPQSPDQVRVLGAGYTARLTDAGMQLAMLYIDSNSNVSTVGSIGVLGKGKIYSLRLTEPLSNQATNFHQLTLGLDYKDFNETVQVSPTAGLLTPVKYLNWSLGYALVGHDAGQQAWSLDATANWGVRNVVNNEGDFANKRFGAKPSYLYLRGDASFTQPLPAHFTLQLRVAGQYSAEPIISNEQYPLGGYDSMRGYLEAETLGDLGIRSTVQLGAPALPLFAGRVHLASFVFLDAGRVSLIDPLPGQDVNTTLRSWGGGFALAAPAGFAASLTWADPLVSGPVTLRGDWRWLFSVRDTW